MIRANELRIGNWIEYDGRYFKIYSIADVFPTLDTIEFGIGVVDYNNINPIPLTPEILEKCGFEKEQRSDYDGEYFYVWIKNGVDIHEGNNSKEFNYATYVKGAQCSFKSGIGVKYLHQLQNLYFALAGEELNPSLLTPNPDATDSSK